jgi:hypothetical protein
MSDNGSSTKPEKKPVIQWAPILGDWSVDTDQIYKGGSEMFAAHGHTFPMGILVNDQDFQSGSCRVDVNFSEIPQSPFSAGLVLGYRSQDRYYVRVQLGASNAAYSVDEFVGGFGWRSIKSAGPLNVLRANRKYSLRATLKGQELRVAVGGVQVLEVLLPRPFEGKQTGLAAAGNHAITFSGFSVDADRPRAFVAMEYSEPFDTFYHQVIYPQTKRFYDVVRIDETAGPGVIFQDMQREIEQSDVFIAEITPANPNVYYELGYAHALNKPTILLAQRGGKLPFDIRSYRVVFYDDSIGGKSRVEEDLAKHLEAIAQSAS